MSEAKAKTSLALAPPPKTELEIIEERREARRKATGKERDAQYLLDMKALDALEEEHGEQNVKPLHVQAYMTGLPTFIVVKSPGGTSFHTRFVAEVRKANGNKQMEGMAQDRLGRSSIVYPVESAAVDAMLLAFPNMLNDAAAAAMEFVKVRAEEEKKG